VCASIQVLDGKWIEAFLCLLPDNWNNHHFLEKSTTFDNFFESL